MTSARSCGSSASPSSWLRTSASQSGMGRLPEPPQSLEELRPFLAKRRKLFLSGGSKAIAAAAAAAIAGFPTTANPAALFHAVEHGVKGGKGEAQSSLGLFLDAPRHFIPVERTFFENT